MGSIIVVLSLSVLVSRTVLSNGALATTLIPLEDQDWLSDPLAIGDNESASEPQMATWRESLYIVWTSSQGIMFMKSTNGGQTFTEPIKLADYSIGSPVSSAPRIVAYNDHVYVIYTSGKDVFLIQSGNEAESFLEPVNISKMNIEDDSAALVTDHVMSVAGNRVYVAWTTAIGDWSEIFFAQSSDGGANFGEHANVSNNPEASMLPKIASFGNDVYLTWTDIDDGNIYHTSFARSSDWGYTFESVTNISANEHPHSSFEPQVAADRGTAYLVWRDEVPINNQTGNIYAKIAFAKSTDSGRTFDITRYIGDGAWPAFAVSGPSIYVAVGVQDSGMDNVGFVKSTDGGSTFSRQILLSNQTWGLHPYDSRAFPQISADGANVFVAWRYTAGGDESGANNHETFLAASYDKG